MSYHVPVLLMESVDALAIKPDGLYVDCTFGGGGHSREMLKRLNEHGRLIAFDQDEDARANLPDDSRLLFVPHNFRHLHRFLRLHKISSVDGILADLGVSSHQFDEAGRGFSIRFDADLDMRMDKRQELTAKDILANYSEQQLHKLFEQYGEVTNAKTLARTIVEVRKNMQIRTINDFRNAIANIVKGNPNKYFAQVFQAIRMEVNDELEALKEMLQQSAEVLNPGGRIAVITFHSIEDRLVKIFFRNGSFDEQQDPQDVFGSRKETSLLKVVNKKPILPAKEELTQNKRSRSAKLRIAEKK